MRYYLLLLALLTTVQVSAQLTIGNEGITILAGNSLTVDGLTLTPSANLVLSNNSIQVSNTPLAGSPNGSINRAYQFGAPITFTGTASIGYLTTELNGHDETSLQLAYSPAANAPYVVTSGNTVNTTNDIVSNTFANKNLFAITAVGLPDLIPLLSTLPSTQYGTTNFTVVVDVFELNATATSELPTVYITKDPLVTLSFNPSLTFVGGKVVQNGGWTFDGTSNDSFYLLRTIQVLGPKAKRSFGLTGVLKPGNTKGALTITTTIAGLSGGEFRLTNNSDSDKIDYFNK
ncbi:hypothetical protein BH09BAC4_BH09BAC4_25390 [soil metagenome]